jgi:hypothetical protein
MKPESTSNIPGSTCVHLAACVKNMERILRQRHVPVSPETQNKLPCIKTGNTAHPTIPPSQSCKEGMHSRPLYTHASPPLPIPADPEAQQSEASQSTATPPTHPPSLPRHTQLATFTHSSLRPWQQQQQQQQQQCPTRQKVR